MYLLEYQAKETIGRAGLPLPAARVVDSPEQAEKAAREIGPCVVKAQLRTGGRGKAGLIRMADSPAEALTAAGEILGQTLGGETVARLLIEERLEIGRELYLGLILDTAQARPAALISLRGGVDIEAVAKDHPQDLVRLDLDPFSDSPDPDLWAEAWQRAGLDRGLTDQAVDISMKLEKLFRSTDALTLEINPLVATRAGQLIAADCKLIVDDAALFRQPELAAFKEATGQSLEERGQALGVTYVSLNEGGPVGVMAGGAGLSMATMDEITEAGALPAAFIDLGGGISEENMVGAIRLMLATRNLSHLIINAFGGINNCEILARGIAQVWPEIKGRIRLVVKMRGHSQTEGWQILEDLEIPLIKMGTTTEAVNLLMETGTTGGPDVY